MREEAFLGIDVGTTSTKTALFHPSGKSIASSSSRYDVINPAPSHYEQNPDEWWNAVRKGISILREKTSFTNIEIISIGVCGQTPTLVFVDDKGKVIRPAIIWKDSRAQKEASFLKETVGEKLMEELIGTKLPIEASWSPAKLLWMKKNEPDTLTKTHKILQPKDYINYKLSGVLASDYWCSKGLVHVKMMKPSDEYYKILGIESNIAPDVFAPSNIVGCLSKEASKELGLREGIPIVAGWADSFCGILGVGAFARSGRAFDISGTSEIVGISVEPFTEIPPGLILVSTEGFQNVVFGPTQSGGGTLDWFTDRFIYDKELSLEEKYMFVDKAVRSSVVNTDSMIFLPFIEGERAPIWNPESRGLFFGVAKSDKLSDFAHSIMSGVAFNIRSIFELLENVWGKEIEEFSVSGGPSKSPVWNKIKCDATGKKIRILENVESSVFGAAMLGALGVGYFNNVTDMSTKMIRIKAMVEPDMERHLIYEELYQKFKRIYSLIRNEF